MKDPLQTVIIGGGFGAAHIQNLVATGRVHLRSLIYNENRSRAVALAQRFQIDTVCNDAREAISDQTDLVVICSPVHAHYSAIALAVESGCMVACDKPLCLSAEEAVRAAELLAANDLPNLMFFQWRLNEGIRRLKVALDEQRVGDLREIHVSFDHDFLGGEKTQWAWRHYWSSAGAGAMGDLGIHMLDLIIWLTGGVPSVSTARGRVVFRHRILPDGRVIETETDDVAHVLLQFEKSDASGSLRVSRVATGVRAASIVVHGSKGSIALSIDADTGSYGFSDRTGPVLPAAGPSISANLYIHWFDAMSKGAKFSPSFRDGAVAQGVLDEAVRQMRKAGC